MSNLSTLEKCVQILTLFTETAPRLSVDDISTRLGIPKSTVYRYLSALREHRLISEDTRPGFYCLGDGILPLARAVIRSGIQEIALPFMRKLQAHYGETVLLSALRNGQGVCLEKVEARHALRVSHDRGAIFPLHAGASGKILLAYLPSAEQERIIREHGLPRFTARTITDPARLREELSRIRAQGHAESDGEVTAGTYGIGAPILDRAGEIVAGLSVAAPSQRLVGRKRERMIKVVVETARQISTAFQAQDF